MIDTASLLAITWIAWMVVTTVGMIVSKFYWDIKLVALSRYLKAHHPARWKCISRIGNGTFPNKRDFRIYPYVYSIEDEHDECVRKQKQAIRTGIRVFLWLFAIFVLNIITLALAMRRI